MLERQDLKNKTIILMEARTKNTDRHRDNADKKNILKILMTLQFH